MNSPYDMPMIIMPKQPDTDTSVYQDLVLPLDIERRHNKTKRRHRNKIGGKKKSKKNTNHVTN